VIVRILGEGQFDVSEDTLEGLNDFDDKLVAALDNDDAAAYSEALAALLDGIRAGGERLPDDYLGPSELVLPGADATIDDVRALLSEEGLIPG
jgi:hypothetical protein